MKESIQDIDVRACQFAEKAHAGTYRKGTNIPYMTHLVETADIVRTLTDNKKIIAAAYLHDVLEDTSCTVSDIEEQFGVDVARLVESETENKYHGKPKGDTWKTRKEETIHHLQDASVETKMITLGDKLSNIRSIKRDYEQIGNQLWERFNVKDPQMHAWYYRSVCDSLKELEGYSAWKELDRLIKEVFNQ